MTKDQFEEAFRAYYKPLVIFALKLIPKQQELAEDIVQQVFLNVWESRETVTVEKGLLAYLYQSTRNRCLNYLNSSYRTTTVPTDIQLSEHLANVHREDLNYSETKELFHRIQEAIQELPDRCREVFLLSREQSLSYKEIAQAMNISVKTVENQMGKALKHLYDRIGKTLICLIIFFLGA